MIYLSLFHCLGKELISLLEKQNIKVIKITTNRKTVDDNTIYWDPSKQFFLNPERLEGIDAVVNLAGENIGSGDGVLAFLGRWSNEKKDKILTSRVNSIQLLGKVFESLKKKPKTL